MPTTIPANRQSPNHNDESGSNALKSGLPCPITPEQGCTNPKGRNSKDAYAFYDDGHGWCHSCGVGLYPDKKRCAEEGIRPRLDRDDRHSLYRPKSPEEILEDEWSKPEPPALSKLKNPTYPDLSARGINGATVKKFGVLRTDDYQGAPGLIFHFRSRRTGRDAVRKVKRNKDYLGARYTVEGSETDSELFGQHLFTGKNRRLIIVEGELDALAAYQMCGSYFAVVSVTTGAGGAARDVKRNIDFVEQFNEVFLAFDGDEAGRRAAKQVARLITPGKCKVAQLTGYKDACEYSQASAGAAFTEAIWAAGVDTPEGIRHGADLLEPVLVRPEMAPLLYPWQGLNDLTYGIRKREMVLVAAGTGQGKSALVKSIAYHIMQTGKHRLGMMFLEESVGRTAQDVVGLHLKKNLRLPHTAWSDEEVIRAFDETLGRGSVEFWEHFGSNSITGVIDRVKYMVQALEVDYIILDHISIIVSDHSQGDERKALDEIATKLRTLIEQTGIGIIVVAHLNRSDGTPHEEGGRVTLANIRGTQGIAQLSDIVLAGERDQQADNPVERNTTQIRVLKNRFTGDTGPACKLLYDKQTGWLTEISLDEYNRLVDAEDMPVSDGAVAKELF